MTRRTLVSLIASVFILILLLTSATMGASGIDKKHPFMLLQKESGEPSSRKLLGFNALLDYDYAGPNPKHDPRGKRGGKP